ncbi:hypothetical protein ABK040_010302 [Willaertia magna]
MKKGGTKAKLKLGNPSDHIDFSGLEHNPDALNHHKFNTEISVSKKKSFHQENVKISDETFEYEDELSIGPTGIINRVVKTPQILETSYLSDLNSLESNTSARATTSNTSGGSGSSNNNNRLSVASNFFLESPSPVVSRHKRSLSACSSTSSSMGDESGSVTGLIKYEDLSGFLKLGSGSSASVVKVFHTALNPVTKKEEKNVYAMKKVYVEKQVSKLIIHEIKALYTNTSPYIVKLYDSFYREGAIMMILEYMDCGSLEDVMRVTKKIPEKIMSRMTYQILKGFQYIHEEKNIIHRDIKPANILINSKGILKIADFGMSGFWLKSKLEEIQKTAKFDTFCGTYIYMSPERIRGQSHSFDSDIWSLGLTVAQLCMGFFPFILKPEFTIWSMFEYLEETKDDPFPIDEKDFTPEFKSFVFQCMTFDRKQRPSASQLLNHPWILKYKKTEDKMVKSIEKWIYKRYIAVKKKKKVSIKQ